MSTSRWWLSFLLGGVLGLVGCQPPSIRTVHDFKPTTGAEQLASIKATPELQSLVSELAREGTKGAVEGATGDEAKGRIEHFVAEMVRAFVAELQASLRAAVGGGRSVGADVAVAAVHAAGDELGRSFGPALRAVVTDLVGDPAVKKGIGDLSHEIGKQAALGTKEALTEDDGTKPQGSVLGALQVFSSGASIVVVLLVVAVFGLPLIWLLRERAAIRRQQDEAARRTAVVRALLESAAADDDPRLQKLLRHVARHLEGDDVATEAPTPRRRVRHA